MSRRCEIARLATAAHSGTAGRALDMAAACQLLSRDWSTLLRSLTGFVPLEQHAAPLHMTRHTRVQLGAASLLGQCVGGYSTIRTLGSSSVDSLDRLFSDGAGGCEESVADQAPDQRDFLALTGDWYGLTFPGKPGYYGGEQETHQGGSAPGAI